MTALTESIIELAAGAWLERASLLFWRGVEIGSQVPAVEATQ